MGRFIKGRTVRMSRRVPPKNISSVRMETAEAPEAAYAGTISSGRAFSFIHPLEGDRRLNSAMMPVGEEAMACFMERWEGGRQYPRKAVRLRLPVSANLLLYACLR